MDIKSLYYFTEVTKDLNITKTAGRLSISQQTLSNHVKRMEDYYGVELLRRKPKLALTYAGEQVLEYAKEQLQRDKNLGDLLADIKNQQKGLIELGAGLLHTTAALPAVLPAFSAAYPQIEIRITNTSYRQLEGLVAAGELDLALVVDPRPNSDVIATPVMEDVIYLCVHDRLLEKYYPGQADRLRATAAKGANLAAFSRLPFSMLTNHLGQALSHCFEEAGFKPQIYTSSANLPVSTVIGLAGNGACFIPKSGLKPLHALGQPHINIFPLHSGGKPLVQKIFLLRHKDRFLSTPAKYLIELLNSYFKALSSS